MLIYFLGAISITCFLFIFYILLNICLTLIQEEKQNRIQKEIIQKKFLEDIQNDLEMLSELLRWKKESNDDKHRISYYYLKKKIEYIDEIVQNKDVSKNHLYIKYGEINNED